MAVSGASASTLELLGSINESGKTAAAADSNGGAKWGSGRGWDLSGTRHNGSETFVSPSLLPEPVGPRLSKPTAILDVGTPGVYKVEPVSPLTDDGKAKKQSSGNGMWWALGGAAAGAGIGFLLGGPIGAAIGGLLGGLAGFFFGP